MLNQTNPTGGSRYTKAAFLSLVLLLFTVPHALEDFSVGEPQKAGVPVLLLALVVAGLVALQGLALYWTGRSKRAGLWLHTGLGLLWPLAAGAAQLPVILAPGLYRSGIFSEILVIGIIVTGIILSVASIQALVTTRAAGKGNPVPE